MLTAKQLTWKAFTYFRSVIDNQSYCDAHVVAMGTAKGTMPASALPGDVWTRWSGDQPDRGWFLGDDRAGAAGIGGGGAHLEGS